MQCSAVQCSAAPHVCAHSQGDGFAAVAQTRAELRSTVRLVLHRVQLAEVGQAEQRVLRLDFEGGVEGQGRRGGRRNGRGTLCRWTQRRQGRR